MASQTPILIAEDDENDIFLLRRALQKAGATNPVQVVRNGKEAIEYLCGEQTYADRGHYPLPGLLLLDLKMPLLDGFDVLSHLRTRSDLPDFPVVVLTSSNQEGDRQKAEQLGADDYRVKPQDFEDLVTIIQELSRRWLDAELRRSEH